MPKILGNNKLKIAILFTPILFVFLFSLALISTSLVLASNLTQNKVVSKLNTNLYSLFSARPKVVQSSSQTLEEGDSRVYIIEQFFQKHNAPLQDYADTIVKEADTVKATLRDGTEQIGIDWRLVPAIAMCESNGGKFVPIHNGESSNNAWGWAASEKDLAEQSGTYVLGSWESAIATVTRGLARGYYNRVDLSDGGIDFDDLWNIMSKYAPPSVEKGGPWAKCVWQYYEELTNFKTNLK